MLKVLLCMFKFVYVTNTSILYRKNSEELLGMSLL